MTTSNTAAKEELQARLDDLVRKGIEADVRRLKKDMTLQFSDPREWIREYVVNAADAMATRVRIAGREDEATLTIIVSDDGHGMDRDGIIDFMTLYRSRKKGDPERAVGKHGVGKLSVAAIPGQCGFEAQSSTGETCWRLRMGCLLDDEAVRVERIEPVPARGTTFAITFKKACSLGEELDALRQVLLRYVRFLPIDILIAGDEADGTVRYLPIRGDWYTTAGASGRHYRVLVQGKRFEVSLGVGNGQHEVYQNRVLVSTKYDLLSYDLAGNPLARLPLLVRVDSPDFDLPFGRHALRNDDILAPLARHVRRELLVDFLRSAYADTGEAGLLEYTADLDSLDRIAMALLALAPHEDSFVRRVRLFSDVFGRRHSLASLSEMVGRRGVLYLEAPDTSGIDYGVFRVPVLTSRQVGQGKEILEKVFGVQLVNLAVADVVLEAPEGSAKELGPRELRFQRHVRFHSRALAQRRRESASGRGGGATTAADFARTVGICEEARAAHDDVCKLVWRVNYLVGPDGRTPAATHLYLHRGQRVVLNLYHPTVQQLLCLSDDNPALAGHLGLAAVLGSPHRTLLKHLSPEACEDLLLADAIAKCGAEVLDETDDDEDAPEAAADPGFFTRLERFFRNDN